MSRNMPLVSWILCVYNGEEYLADTMDSILGQTYPNWELIAIDDCSTDGTPKILADYAARDSRVKIHRNPENLRLQKSLNRGLSLANGAYVARIDADDICALNRLERQVAFMEARPEIQLSFCRYLRLINGKIQRSPFNARTSPEALHGMLLFTNPVIHPGVIARREAICSLKYREDLTCTEDLELWQRMDLQGMKMAAQNEYLLLYRIHDKQITATSAQRQRDEFIRVTREFYKQMLFELTPEQEKFLTTGVYFIDQVDPAQLISLFTAIRKANREKGRYTNAALHNSMFEIVVRYKNSGISRKELLRLLLFFPPHFVAAELIRRKVVNRLGMGKIESLRTGTGKEYPWVSL